MANIQELTKQVIEKELSNPSKTFDFKKFEFVLGLLRPFLELDSSQLTGIFETLDEGNKGQISAATMIDLMKTLSEVPEEDQEELPPEENPNGNQVPSRTSRVSLTYDTSRKMFRASTANKQSFHANESGELGARLDYSFIDSMDLEKLSEMKHLFEIVSRSSKA